MMCQVLPSKVLIRICLLFGTATAFETQRLFSWIFDFRSDVTKCLASNDVSFATSRTPNWGDIYVPYNLRLIWEPTVVTFPETDDQVSKSVTCAAAAGLKVQAKGGGRSYASYSNIGENGGMVISLEKFSEINVDQKTFVAKIGGGQRLSNVAEGLYNQGKRAMPHGTCPSVGVAGHALHGGYGYDSRKWGLALDYIIALDVVLANGTQVHTDKTHHPDIFWAMRGAGESFGIATKLYFKTEKTPKNVLYFVSQIGAEVLKAPFKSGVDILTDGLEKLQDFSWNSPLLTPNITFGTYVSSNGTFLLRGWCMDCSVSALEESVLPEMMAGFPIRNDSIQDLGWIAALTEIGAPDALSQPLGSAYKGHDTFYAKSLVTRDTIPLTRAAFKAYSKVLLANQGVGSWFSIFNIYGGQGSAINAIPSNQSSYSDRNSFWVFQNYGNTPNGRPPYHPNTTDIVDALNDKVVDAQPDGGFNMYMNYIDPHLSARTAAKEYYGAATYNRLLALKKVLDPDDLFWNPQSVGNSKPLV